MVNQSMCIGNLVPLFEVLEILYFIVNNSQNLHRNKNERTDSIRSLASIKINTNYSNINLMF